MPVGFASCRKQVMSCQDSTIALADKMSPMQKLHESEQSSPTTSTVPLENFSACWYLPSPGAGLTIVRLLPLAPSGFPGAKGSAEGASMPCNTVTTLYAWDGADCRLSRSEPLVPRRHLCRKPCLWPRSSSARYSRSRCNVAAHGARIGAQSEFPE